MTKELLYLLIIVNWGLILINLNTFRLTNKILKQSKKTAIELEKKFIAELERWEQVNGFE